jgi:hypothetical protein
LVKLDEANVTVYCRAADVGAVKKVLDGAKNDYTKLMKAECGEDIKIKLAVNEGVLVVFVALLSLSQCG